MTSRSHTSPPLMLAILLSITLSLSVVNVFVSTVSAASTPSSQAEAVTAHSLVAALHVHSTISTGTLTLDQLAERARQRGIDVIVLSENFGLRYEYGLPLLRGPARVRVSVPSISSSQAATVLQDLAAAQARNLGVLFVPGIEVAPHYYWTGSLLTQDLTMHNSQRNLLVLGLTTPQDYAALPATGNRASHRYGWQTFLDLSPVLLFIPAVRFWRQGTHHGHRRGKVAAVAVALAGIVLLTNAWPFTQPLFSTYDGTLGYQPYQALIDAATERGGLVLWSLPEARDHNEYSFGPLGTVTVQTRPHPEAVLRTTGYTGFGGLYLDTRHSVDPGGIWDQALLHYLSGQRRSFPVLIGEIAFHTPGEAGVHLHKVLNVLRVQERSVEGVLDAIRKGRLYAVAHYPEGIALRLTQFSVRDIQDGQEAQSGDTLQLAEPTRLAVDVALEAVNQQPYPVTITLIRSGERVASAEGQTPFHYRHFEKMGIPVKPGFYRVEVKAVGAEILSNPIFFTPKTDRKSNRGVEGAL